MNNDNVKGSLEKISGKIKETVGDLTGNETLKREGQAEQIKGSVHDTLGNAKNATRDTLDTTTDAAQVIADRVKSKVQSIDNKGR